MWNLPAGYETCKILDKLLIFKCRERVHVSSPKIGAPCSRIAAFRGFFWWCPAPLIGPLWSKVLANTSSGFPRQDLASSWVHCIKVLVQGKLYSFHLNSRQRVDKVDKKLHPIIFEKREFTLPLQDLVRRAQNTQGRKREYPCFSCWPKG